MTAQRIGFIGVGAMGLPMALNLLKAGFPVTFTSRRREAVRALEEAGATAVPTPPLVAEQSDIVLTCLPADRELEEVCLGPDGILEHMRPGTTLIDFTTASPMIVQRIASEASARQIRVVDAPVSGGVTGAERGTLSIMVGSDPAVFEAVRPVLAAVGEQLYHVGDVGMGKVFKIVNQLLNGTILALTGEALSLAANAGADLEKLYEVISTSSGNSRAWADAVPKLLHEQGGGGFRLELMRKDLGLATALADDLTTPLALTSTAYQLYVAACARGMGKLGSQDVARLVARLSNASFTVGSFESDAVV